MKDQIHLIRPPSGLVPSIGGVMVALLMLLVRAAPICAQTTYPSWRYTGNLIAARSGETATRLQNGKVLVVGGYNPNSQILNSAELYDPATETWSLTGNLNTPRAAHTATLLPTGKVLVLGGYGVDTAELYDPATGVWSNTGSPSSVTDLQTATLLANGKVLVIDFNNNPQLYDPAAGTWTSTGRLHYGFPYGYTATLLTTGKILVAGGDSFGGCGGPITSAELYDPVTGTWAFTGSLNTPHEYHTATLLPDGRVLVAGGYDFTYVENNTAELYDPATGSWSRTPNLNSGRVFHTATVLPNGNVLVVEGYPNNGSPLPSAELYDRVSGTWKITAYLKTFHYSPTSTLLQDGRVLVTGSSASGTNSNNAELFDPVASPNANLSDDAQFFVHQHYEDFLNREPDPDGLAYWINQITSCGADTLCTEIKRINVSAAFFLSIEFQETGYLVYRIHKSAYGNLPALPVPVRFSDFLWDTREIGYGVEVGIGDWQGQLESNKQNFTSSFVFRSRFSDAYPTTMTPAQFVDALIAHAGVTLSAAERTAVINEFGSATNTNDNAARARALRRVAENSTFKQQEFNRAFVLMQYFGYLRRNPDDPPEPGLNFDGYNFWLNKLNNFNGNFIDAEMVKSFLVSGEYRQRFGP